MSVSNADVARLSGQVFAHTSDYQLPVFFANRQAEQSELMSFVRAASTGPRVAVVSDLLGSGKTFLVEMALRNAEVADTTMLPCGASIERMKAAEGRGFIGLDEWDIKASPTTLVRALEQLKGYFDQNEHAPPVIIIGDRTLKHPEFRGRLGRIALHDVAMEPLNPKFFKVALRNRMLGTFGDEGAAQEIVAPALLEALVPDWPETVAVFREVLRALKEMADLLPSDHLPCKINDREAVAWAKTQPLEGLKPTQLAFYRAFVQHLRDNVRIETLAPFTTRDLLSFAAPGTDPARLGADILVPMVRNGLLGAIGRPSFSADYRSYDRYPGPYLPTPVTLVRALYGVSP